MSDSFRRFEILLPLQFNDGQPVPDELIGQTLIELRTRFGAASCETQVILGEWEHHDLVFRDKLVRLFVDAPNTVQSRQFFLEFKELLKARFKQLDIWLTTYPIEAL